MDLIQYLYRRTYIKVAVVFSNNTKLNYMNKKEFKERIDNILNADTPELQLNEINKLWGLVKNCNIPPVSNHVNCQHEKGRRTSVLSDYWKCLKCGEIFKGN